MSLSLIHPDDVTEDLTNYKPIYKKNDLLHFNNKNYTIKDIRNLPDKISKKTTPYYVYILTVNDKHPLSPKIYEQMPAYIVDNTVTKERMKERKHLLGGKHKSRRRRRNKKSRKSRKSRK